MNENKRVSVVATMYILPGKESEAIPALKQLAANVKEREPDALVYIPQAINREGFNVPPPYPNEIVFIEIYKDQAAFDLHLHGPDGPDNQSGSYTEFVKEYGHLFVSDPASGGPMFQAKSLNQFAGFVRDL